MADQSANPLVRLDTGDLLRQDTARRLLSQAGVSGAEDLAWERGPTALAAPEGASDVSMLGTSTGVEHFAGVAGGETGPWGLRIHVARITGDDHVIAAGVDRRPLASADGGFVDGDHGTRLGRGRELLAETLGRLESQ